MNRSNSSHDPVCKTGRGSVLNPLESGFSHELPDNDKHLIKFGHFAQLCGHWALQGKKKNRVLSSQIGFSLI
jgi:hypothetical protein